MDMNTLKGDLKAGVGRAEAATGEAFGDPALQTRGTGRRVVGEAQTSLGQAQELFGQAADQARAAAARVGDAYDRAERTVRDVADTVDPFVRTRPYTTLGIAAAAGLLVGLLIAGRGPKVIYVKPRV